MDKAELRSKLKHLQKLRDEIYPKLEKAREQNLTQNIASLEKQLKEYNKEIKFLQREIKGDFDSLFCTVNLTELRDALVKEELKQMEQNPELQQFYCELKPVKVVCYDSNFKLGNHFVDGASIKENLEILTKQQYLAFKVLIPTNNSEHTYTFGFKLHYNKKMAKHTNLKQRLIETNFNPNKILAENFYVDITIKTLQKYYKTNLEEVLGGFITMPISCGYDVMQNI